MASPILPLQTFNPTSRQRPTGETSNAPRPAAPGADLESPLPAVPQGVAAVIHIWMGTFVVLRAPLFLIALLMGSWGPSSGECPENP